MKMLAVYGFKVAPVYLFISSSETKQNCYNAIAKITLGSVKIPDMVHLVYSAWLGQSKEEREEEKTSYMRLRDYFEKSTRRGASASLMDAANEHDWRLTKYSQYVTQCNYACFCV